MKNSLESLRHWFLREKRPFPWRENPSPYAVWVSEVMLQQTRAPVVIPYFNRWMKKFPTIEALAEAPIEEVIKEWEGLGYYSRARSLHAGARKVVEEFGGKLPSDAKLLSTIKGLGPYTIGAIQSFAFHKKGLAVDGNVFRVISRLFLIEEEIDRPAVQQKIRGIVEDLLPDTEPHVMMEAFIELGATACGKRPNCLLCPVKSLCKAFAEGRADELPKKKPRAKVTVLKRRVYVVKAEDRILLQRHEGDKLMSGLWEFPFVDEGVEFTLLEGPLVPVRMLGEVTHTFTRFRAHLFPSVWQAEKTEDIDGYTWVKRSEMNKLPFSSGHKKIHQMMEE